MKKQIKIAATLLLTLFMLISTVGFSLNKMICLYSGKVKVAVFEDVNCNPDEEQNHSEGIDARCCDFLSEYIQIDFLSLEKPVKIPQVSLAILTVLFFDFSLPEVKNSLFSSIEAPPLRFGFNLLKLISVFRI
ncbi:MAG: hypothetical protein H0X62_13255 [Bacteroidetes bacterium]|nr:hypothetical protein [Bacteroidota bacterium]